MQKRERRDLNRQCRGGAFHKSDRCGRRELDYRGKPTWRNTHRAFRKCVVGRMCGRRPRLPKHPRINWNQLPRRNAHRAHNRAHQPFTAAAASPGAQYVRISSKGLRHTRRTALFHGNDRNNARKIGQRCKRTIPGYQHRRHLGAAVWAALGQCRRRGS